MERNLTVGSVPKNLLYFALPYLMSYFLQTLYGMADLFIVGQFAPVAATTAVSIGSQVMHMLTVVLLGLAMGTTVQVAQAVGGDMRKALGCLEFAAAATVPDADGVRTVTQAMVRQVAQRSSMKYDKSDDNHYDAISALQKSIRGSDPDAAVHYLARILIGGDLLSACRRLLVIAAEDIGLAYPQAIPVVKACVDSARELGLPEASAIWRILLSNLQASLLMTRSSIVSATGQ